MIKKSLITIAIFFLIATLSCSVLATNITSGAENTVNQMKNGVQNMANDAGGAIQHAKDGIGNMVNDGKNMIENGAKGLGNTTQNVANTLTSDTLRGEDGRENSSNDTYTANRTSATNVLSTSNPAILWTILAVIALAIIGVVWYYGIQTQTRHH